MEQTLVVLHSLKRLERETLVLTQCYLVCWGLTGKDS